MRRWLLLAVLLPAPAVAQPVINTVVNGGSFDGRLCPGVVAFIFGNNLGPQQPVSAQRPIPFSLGGVSVTVNQRPAALFLVSLQQLNVQIPVELAAGPATLVIEYEGRRSAPLNLSLVTHAPALLTANFFGTGPVVFERQNGLGGAQNPASPGEFIFLYGVGLGPTNPVVPTGAASPVPPATTVTAPRVTIGGRSVTPLFSGLAPGFVAYYQISVQVPGDTLPGSYPIFIEIAGFTSPPVTLPVGVLGGMALTQSGFTFQAVQGGGTPSAKSFKILNGAGARLNFSNTTSTISGGSGWLSVSPATGAIETDQASPVLNVSVNQSGLAAGDYYGQIRVEGPGAPNSPQFLSVVLNVAAPTVNPGPVVEPTGLVFVGQPGGAQPASQSVRVTNLTATATAFTTAASFDGAPN